MPELPEVETVKNGLIPVMQGKAFRKVILNRKNLRFPFPENFQHRLEGQTLVKLTRRAKFLLGELSTGEYLLMHLGMSGRFIVGGARGNANPKHDHVVFTMNDKDMSGNIYEIIYNDPRRFGFMELLAKTDAGRIAALGPEPLSNRFNGPVLHQALMGKKSPIKTALLDQRIIAGLGNIYVCEALYESRISPLRKAKKLDASECETLSHEIKAVLNKAILAGGSSLKDFAQTDGALGYFQHQFRVYDKVGSKCAHDGCAGTIVRLVQSGRSSFYCPNCQK